ncbi:MAG TPA: patatin-like phospholipase family protein [Candidatus Polarisedimenticolaceae bacterium]|nr:patatin-like phospholipase family protein [Candidatus Polarisedimenticolaceae bacterium]
MRKIRSDRGRIGLALAGGGFEGAVYEIGALYALSDSLDGFDLNRDVDIFVGVSAGAFVASCLANGLTTRNLVRAMLRQSGVDHPFAPEVLFSPAIGEIVNRTLMTPRLLVEAMLDYVRNPEDLSLLESLTRLSRALPVAMFDNEPIRAYLEGIFSLPGRTDDFRQLKRRLVVVATDLDSGEAVRFGAPGADGVPISSAVQASTALPGLYPPVLIDGRHYVDGVLLKTLHASVALEANAELVFCINPIVPVDTAEAVNAGAMKRGKLIHRGLPTVMSQTFRTLVHSRLSVGLASYEPRFPGQHVVLFEPPRDDYRMFFTNVFRFSSRKRICEHAFDATRRQLRERRETLEPLLAGSGITYRNDRLADPARDLWGTVGLGATARATRVTAELGSLLDRLESILERLEAKSVIPG